MIRDFHKPSRSAAMGIDGMVATSHPLAVQAGLEILKEGGTAADAAIAAVAVMAVVEPAMTGIGGDCFCLVAKPGADVWGYNGSGRAPKGASAAALRALGITAIASTSPHAVTVPGAIEAWDRILKTHGRFGFDRVLRPAIHHARNGWPVHPRVAFDWAGSAEQLAKDDGAAKHYLVSGAAPRAGAVMHLPALADTLEKIAKHGAKAFYQGEVAEDIVATLHAKGSPMTLDDLAAHRGTVETPISTRYRDINVLELPPNGQGITALIMLNILENFDLQRLGPSSAARMHLGVEAARLAYSLRDAHVSDPATMRVKPATLLDKAYAKKLAAMIDPERRTERLAPQPPSGSDTIYLSVVDKDRMSVSFINSLFAGFGTKICTPKSGILLQNRGSGFTLEEGHANELAGGKRPMHTIIPAMLAREGEVFGTFGVMGGQYQSAGHTQVVSALVDHGLDPQAAIDLPRAFFEGEDTVVEPPLGDTIVALAVMGHRTRHTTSPLGGGQMIIMEKSGVLIGGSDPRKDGMALGY